MHFNHEDTKARSAARTAVPLDATTAVFLELNKQNKEGLSCHGGVRDNGHPLRVFVPSWFNLFSSSSHEV